MATDLSRLRAWLNSTKLQVSSAKDFNRAALFQTIKELINKIDEIQTTLNIFISGGSSSGGGFPDEEYIVSSPSIPQLPNSKQLIAGNYIAFDTSIANQLTINAAEWSVLTNGDPVTPELVWDSNGDVIMTVNP